MKRFAADLHIHTALSPCAAPEMTPGAITRAALSSGVKIIAICDHNAVGNVTATMAAASDGLTVIAGMEVTTAEEVHVVGLFPDQRRAAAAGREVGDALPPWSGRGKNNQLLLDGEGRVIGREPRMLAAALPFDLHASVALLRRHSGIAIAAHVNRRSFNVFSQLGLPPEDLVFDAVELSAVAAPPPWADRIALLDLPVLMSSDSHFLEQVGTHRTVFELETPTFGELKMALRAKEGRRITARA